MHSGHRIPKGLSLAGDAPHGALSLECRVAGISDRTRVTSTVRWRARMRSLFAVARPVVISSAMIVEVKPCGSKIEVVQPGLALA